MPELWTNSQLHSFNYSISFYVKPKFRYPQNYEIFIIIYRIYTTLALISLPSNKTPENKKHHKER